jgi:nucleoside-diphosphate-sugar epimerase
MKVQKPHSVLILGGAGFLGSEIAKVYAKKGSQVTVIDGLMPRTGGNKKHLSEVLSSIQFIDKRIEQVTNLSQLLDSHDLIINCMGWTLHFAAVEDPFYDLELNLQSHLHLIKHLKEGHQVIFLGSRSQYGVP